MRDRNTRALLVEAVIAGGLVAVGIATCQPLVAIASSAAGVGGNWAFSLAERGFHHWRDQWFTNDGVLNHDIAAALSNSFVDAVRQVEYDWEQHRQYKHLKRKYPEQALATLSALRSLREEGLLLFQQMHQISQVAQQQPGFVSNMMYQNESKANECLKPLLAKFLQDYDDEFVEFVSMEMGPKWILRFLEILKDPGTAGTRAWRACQLLWQKSLMLSIDQMQRTTAETAEAVHWLQAWALQLKSLPPTERDFTGQDALTTTLHSVQNQVSEVQKKLAEAYDVAVDTRETALVIQSTLDEYAPVFKAQARSMASGDKYRLRLLEKVQSTWIEEVLDRSIEEANFVRLGLYERPDLVENTWESHVQEVKRTERQLPAGTSITQIYDKAMGELLLLGEPGSGKTTLLLHLASELLERAKLDKTLPIPVVFNLSTWAEKHQPLSEWLIEELHTRYTIPPKIGKPWIENDEVLPLLDGLDEVVIQHRPACIKAINVFRQTQGLSSIVVGCRIAEYAEQSTKLILQQAIFVQPMTLPQIYEYLGGEEGQLQSLLHDELALQGLAQNPLMLSILKQTYQGKKIHISENISPVARRQQIFTDYVESVFNRRGIASPHSPKQTKDWLTWLARRMKQEGKTVFYLEHMQINWLTNVRSGEIFTSLAFSLLSFPFAVGLLGLEYSSYGLKFALTNSFMAGLLVAIIAFFFVLSIETRFRVVQLLPLITRKKLVRQEEEENERQAKSNTFLTSQFWERVGFALLSGLLLGLLVEFLVGPLYGAVNGLFLVAFLIALGKLDRKIYPTEKLIWSKESLRKNALVSLLIGLGIGVFGGLFDAYPYFQQLNVFLTTLYFWLSLGTALGLIIMLMRGYSKDEIDKSQRAIKPNQGIRNSLSNSIKMGLPSGLLLGLVIFFFYSYVIHNVFVVGYLNEIPQDSYIIYSIGDAVAVTYLFWLINGGFACVQHFVLRFLLWRTKQIPWHYSRFLDYADQRALLRKIGGGYIFIHILLRNYFVGLGAEKILAKGQTSTTTVPLAEEFTDDGENGDNSTEPRILVPVLSATPHTLPCGHKQSNLQAQFCFVCGRPVPPELLEQKTTVSVKRTTQQ